MAAKLGDDMVAEAASGDIPVQHVISISAESDGVSKIDRG
jgi:hypothetical protein